MKIFLEILLGLILFAILASAIDGYRLRTVVYSLSSGKINKDIKIVFLSDLHNHVFGQGNHRLFKEIDRQNPDIILVGGDMIIANSAKRNVHAEEVMKHLCGNYPVYFALGNHEERAKNNEKSYHGLYPKFIHAIHHDNLHILDNDSIELPEFGIRITGLSIGMFYYQKKGKHRHRMVLNVGSLTDSLDQHLYQIALAHNPDYFSSYDAWKFDLTLSGHNHGGLLRLPGSRGFISASLRFFTEFAGGMKHGKYGKMIISRGLGAHTLPVRIFNPCELVTVEIKKEN